MGVAVDYSFVEHLSKSVGLGKWRLVRMAFLTGYFDESEGETHCSVGGFIGEAEQLIRLEQEWLSLLQDYGLTNFHMKDYAHSNGEFRSWKGDEIKRCEFMRRAIGILKRRSRVVIGVVIEKAGFKIAYTKSDVYPILYKNEYAAAALLSLLKCSTWAKRAEVESPLAYVFDVGNQRRPDFQYGFDAVRTNPILDENDHLFGSLTFADDKKVLPLQLSDLVAWELNKWCSDRTKEPIRAPRKTLSEIMNMPNHITIATSDLLDLIAERCNTARPGGPIGESTGCR